MNIEKAVLTALGRESAKGLKQEQIASELHLDGKARRALEKVIEQLLESKRIERAAGGRYRLPRPEDDELEAPPDLKGAIGPGGAAGPAGRIRVHPAGYAFVVREDGEVDVYVSAKNRGSALDGDRVRLLTWAGFKGTEGRVTEVIERGRAKITGTIMGSGRYTYLEPDDPRIAATGGQVALPDGPAGAKVGQAVVAEITRYPSKEGEPLEARVASVLGDPDDPRTEVAKILVCADITTEFAPDTLAAATRAPTEVRAEDLADRVDLRDREFLTIDPETARDFDDAVCVEREEGKPWRLWVAIADVSHYVRPQSALDNEARARGCSVYLPDRAIPMLPTQLSAGICSLNPEVDRLAMVARLDLDERGEVVGRHLLAGVIRSRARLDYAGVAAALAGDFRGPRARYKPWEADLLRCKHLGDLMRARRMARGSLDFDIPEAAVILDEDDPRRVRDVRKAKPNADIKTAYRLVEEFMLAANEAVAARFRELELDTLWRVHAVPDPERIEAFTGLAEALGVPVSLGGQTITPKKVQAMLAEIAGSPSERALSYLLLRSLKQAVYDVVNVGHFGLAAPDYLHFTSPIRRYPDLIVHRLLKYQLHREGIASGLTAERAEHEKPPSRQALTQMAVDSSASERRAMTAEREVVDMYRAFLMRDRIGEEYDATISGVQAFGFFVEIQDPFIEGLVRVEALGDDFYEFEEDRFRLVGRRSGRAFSLGDEVRVRVESVSVARRKVEVGLISGGTIVLEGPLGRKRVETPRRKPGGDRRPSTSGGRPTGGRPGRGQRPGRRERAGRRK